MKSEFRASGPADADAIVGLCSEVLSVPKSSPVLWLPHLHWKYWDARPGWSGSRSFVIALGDEVIAHAGVVPVSFLRRGRTYTLLQLLDWAAAPRHAGAGVALLRGIARLAQGVINVRGSETAQRIFDALGFRSLGTTTRYALRLPRRVAPSSVSSSTLLARSAELRVHRAGVLETAAAHPLELVESNAERIVPLRSREQVEALSRCPVAPMTHCEVWAEGALIGTFLICATPGQVRLVDAWAAAEPPEAWQVVVELALEQASAFPEPEEMVTQTNDSAEAAALLGAGFVAVGSDALSILADRELVRDGAYVRHQLIDSDLAYLHHGVRESWGA